jgi:tetratricopeptide (TPR) repeat protein
MTRATVGLLASLLALVGPGRARAQAPGAASAEDASRAKLHFEAGSSYYREGDYRAALREYETAYRFAPRPALLYNVAQCWDRLGDKPQTVAFLRRYLEAEPAAEDRAAVEQWIANLERALEEARRPPPPAPEPESATPPSVAAGPPTESKPGGRFYTWIAAGTAGALGAAGLTVGLLARSKYNDLRDGCGQTAEGCSDGDIDGVRGRALWTNVLLGASAAALATAGVLWFVETPATRVGAAGTSLHIEARF